MPASIITIFIVVTVVLVLLIGFRGRLTRSREGKILAFLALLVLPVVSVWGGLSEQMDRAQSTAFCLSCHVMNDFGRSLHVDDASYIPARHFQNNLVPRGRACYTCHTDYGMFGGMKAKLRGVRHILVEYLGAIPKPEDIKLYEPYNNRECLHCHLGARRFEEASGHHKAPDLLASVKSGKRSCLSSGCHDTVHDVGSLKDATFWKEIK
jgi:cytochrome c nitrite reductase small subunit